MPLNKVMLIGNLGQDPEVRQLTSGAPVVSFSLATSETWRDKSSGEKKERTEWHRIVIFNENLCKIAEQYLKKGQEVYLEGELNTRKWTDKDNVEKFTTEVVLRAYRGELVLLRNGGGGNRPPAPSEDAYGAAPSSGGGGGAMDDDIPFAPEWR